MTKVTDGGSLNLLRRSFAEYNVNKLGLQKRKSTTLDAAGDAGEPKKSYISHCSQREVCSWGYWIEGERNDPL